MKTIITSIIFIFITQLVLGQKENIQLPELQNGQVTVKDAGVLSKYKMCHRQDASAIIKVDSTYYVYYATTPVEFSFEKKSGKPFHLTIRCASSTDEGETWTEHGSMLPEEDSTAWHSTMRHAPHVVKEGDTFYMYFTYMDREVKKKHVALATSKNPLGPFEVDEAGAKLSPDDPFDNALVDDVCIIKYKDLWHMYYKGRPEGTDAKSSAICLATSKNITGPWKKHPKGGLFLCHTANLWPHRTGVAAISANPNYEILYAPDGVNFTFQTKTSEQLRDGGTFCPDATNGDGFGNGIKWGIFMKGYDPLKVNYFQRFFLDMSVKSE